MQCIVVEPSPAAVPPGTVPEDDKDRDMTCTEKEKLMEAIHKLNSKKLTGMVAILRERMPLLGKGTGGFEVNLDDLDRKTLWDLQRFVNVTGSKKGATVPKLMEAIHKLKSEELHGVVAILRESMPLLGKGTDGIEVDFDDLDRKTLWDLQRFVSACRSRKKKKARHHHTTVSRMAAITLERAQTDERIDQLQRLLNSDRLNRLNPTGGNYNTGSDSD